MRLQSPLPDEGVKVPVWATFTGCRSVRFLALAANSYSPLLRLHEDRVAFKVIRAHTRPFADIERVDAFRWRRTNQITLVWRGEWLTLTANILMPRLQVQVLEFFESRGVPLSGQARELLALPIPRS